MKDLEELIRKRIERRKPLKPVNKLVKQTPTFDYEIKRFFGGTLRLMMN